MTTSNSERLYTHFQKLFLKLDHIKVAKKLHLKYDNDNLYISFFNIPFSVNRHTANVTNTLNGNNNCYRKKLLILHHLYFHKVDAENSGNMVAFRNLRECSVFEPAYQKMTLTPFVEYFNKKSYLLKKRAIDTGGQITTGADVSFIINAFPLIPLQFFFWDGDDEFPANANILFDKNIAQFIHPESIPVLADAGTKLLMVNDNV
jgi:hypothetical protein